jgi:hypothetical protein
VPYSYTETTATPGQSVFSVPFPYLSHLDVHLFVNDIEVDPSLLVWSSATVFNAPTLEGGETVKVQRITPATTPLVTYAPGAIVHRDLNTSIMQLLYIVQEAYDTAQFSAGTAADREAVEAIAEQFEGIALAIEAISNYLPQIAAVSTDILAVRAVSDHMADVMAAVNSAEVALAAKLAAIAAAEVSGIADFFDTNAELQASLGDASEDDILMVWEDETQDGAQTFYVKEGGVAVLKLNSDQRIIDAIGLAQNFVSAKKFGVRAGGDTGSGPTNQTAMQDAVEYCIAQGEAWLVVPPGVMRFTEGFNLHNTSGLKVSGSVMRGSVFLIDYEDPGGTFIDGTNPEGVEIADRFKHLALEDITFKHSTAVTYGNGPTPFRRMQGTDFYPRNLHFVLNGGPMMELSSLFNCILTNMTSFGSGFQVPYKTIPDGVTFSQTAGSNVLNATGGTPFEAADVGMFLRIEGNPTHTVVQIKTFNSSTQVVTEETAPVAIVAEKACWGAMTADVTSGLDTIETKVAVDADLLVGKSLFLPGAMAGTGSLGSTNGHRPLYAKVLEVDGTTVTLDRAATRSVSGTPLCFPAMPILSDNASGRENNDIIINGLNIEQFSGVGLVIEEGYNVHVMRAKLHGNNNGVPAERMSHANAMFVRTSGLFVGDIEGACASDAQVLVYDQIGKLTLRDITGAQCENQWFAKWDNGTSIYGRLAVLGVTRNNYLTNRTLDRVVNTVHETPAPIYEEMVSYQNNGAGKRLMPIAMAYGNFVSAFQTMLQAVVKVGSADGYETIVYGEVPTFQGVRLNGTRAAPTTVLATDILARWRGRGRTPDGNLKSGGMIDIVARSAIGDIIHGDIYFRLFNAAGTQVDSHIFRTDGHLPLPTNALDLGSSSNMWRSIFAQRLRLFPEAAVSPGINGEMTFQKTSNTLVKLMLRGDDGVVRSADITLS